MLQINIECARAQYIPSEDRKDAGAIVVTGLNPENFNEQAEPLKWLLGTIAQYVCTYCDFFKPNVNPDHHNSAVCKGMSLIGTVFSAEGEMTSVQMLSTDIKIDEIRPNIIYGELETFFSNGTDPKQVLASAPCKARE